MNTLTVISDQSDMPLWTGRGILIAVGLILAAVVLVIVGLAITASRGTHTRRTAAVEATAPAVRAPNLTACSFLTCDQEGTWTINGWHLCLKHAEQYLRPRNGGDDGDQ